MRTLQAFATRLAVLAVVTSLLACGRGGVIQDAWQQIDLWERPPVVLHPVEPRPTPLHTTLPTLRERRLRVLDSLPGERLAWRLSLGRDAHFRARTIASGGDCWFRVAVRESDGPDREIFRRVQGERGANVAPVSTVDLGAYAGRNVVVSLETGPEGSTPCRRAMWATPSIAHRAGAPLPPRLARPNVILLGLDTVRADALGIYGRTPSPTPALDAFATRSDVWLDAFASTNNTNPSFVSLLTGLYAKNHGVYDLTSRLAASIPTLAEILSAQGYHTWGVTAATHLGFSSGLDRGFDIFVGPEGQFFAETVIHTGLTWLEQPLDRPFFLFLHFFDPHVPHNPPAPFHLGVQPDALAGFDRDPGWAALRERGPRRFDPRSDLPGHADLYPGELAYLDRELDRFFGFLDSRGLLDTSIVAIVGDHGETLGERGRFFDHAGLHDETVHVPLIVHWPGQETGRRIPGLVQHLDLFATLLANLEIDAPPNDAADLIPWAETGHARRAVFAEHANGTGAMVRQPGFKYVTNRDPTYFPTGASLFDLANDPEEKVDLAGRGLEIETELSDLLERWLADRRSLEAPRAVVPDDEERARLEALGYGG